MRRAHSNLLIAFLLLLAPMANGADIDGDGFETVLFPLAFRSHADLPGSRGTIWSGEVWADNRNSTGVHLWGCAVPIVCPLRLEPQRASVIDAPLGVFRPELGFRLAVPIEQASHLTFSNRIFERTLRSQPRGIDVPVVREGEFFDSEETFLAVPSGPEVRITLRVYDPWSGLSAFGIGPNNDLHSVEVKVSDRDENPLGMVSLTPVIEYPTTAREDVGKPGITVIQDLAEMFPAINEHASVHVRVNAVLSGTQYWAMISVTDNETQTVSIVTAQ